MRAAPLQQSPASHGHVQGGFTVLVPQLSGIWTLKLQIYSCFLYLTLSTKEAEV